MKMTAAFASLGHDVLLIVPDRGPTQPTDDVYKFYGAPTPFPIKVLRWLPIRGRSFLFAIHAVANAKRSKATLVYTRSTFTALCAALLRMDVMLELHAACRGRQIMEMISLARLHHVRKVVCISNALAQRIRSDFPLLDSRVMVAHDGADPSPDKEVAQLAPTDADMNAGYVGHLYPGKGMETIAELATRCQNVHFHVVGGMPQDIERWRERLRGARNVTFYGFIPPSEVYRYLNAFDVLLAPYGAAVNAFGGPSDIANWMSPLKLFEYMASGKAIICADLAPLREVLVHEKTALLCQPDSIEEWSSALERLARERNLREAIGINARAAFMKDYTWSARAEKVVGVS